MCVFDLAPNRLTREVSTIFRQPRAKYPMFYDETFSDVSNRIADNRSTGKLDIVGLAFGMLRSYVTRNAQVFVVNARPGDAI